eukprot:16446593-Heterocapsa_arctica.AAC.1
MPVVIMHKDLEEHRTCVRNKGTKQVTMGDLPKICEGKACITCKARTTGTQMMGTSFDIDNSTVIAHFVEMKQNPSFKTWTAQEKIDKLSEWMVSMVQTEKRSLADMGATRMSQKAGMEYMKGTGSLEYIYATLVEVTSAGQTGRLGYALYRSLDKKDYAKTMARITTNVEVKRMTVTSKGK